MSDTAQLIQIINNVLQANDTNLRKQSEDILTNLRNEKPNELICAFLEILKGNPSSIQATTHSNAEISQPVSCASASLTSALPPIPMFGISSGLKFRSPSKSGCLRLSTTKLI